MERGIRIRRLRPPRAIRRAERARPSTGSSATGSCSTGGAGPSGGPQARSGSRRAVRTEGRITAMMHRLMPQAGLARGGALVLALAATAACVSPQEHQSAKDLAKHYETRLHDLERENERLNKDNERLRGE